MKIHTGKKKVVGVILGMVITSIVLIMMFINPSKELLTSNEEVGTDTFETTDDFREDGSEKLIDTYQVKDDERPTLWFFNEEIFTNWEMPLPKINPLGEESAYEKIKIDQSDYYDFKYYSNRLYLENRRSRGNIWTMTYNKVENSIDPEYEYYQSDFKRYIEGMGGNIEGMHNSGFVFSLKDDLGYQVWGKLSENYNDYELILVEEKALLVGDTMIINPKDYDTNYTYFMTYNDDGQYLSSQVYLNGGRGEISVQQNLKFNDYERTQYYTATLDSERESYYRLNDLPLDQSYGVWKVTWYDPPESIEIKLDHLGQLTPIEGSEDLGAVLVSAKAASDLRFIPDGQDTYVSHIEFGDEPVVDRTDDDDFLVYLPSGMWRAEFMPQEGSLVSHYATQLIPVQAGHITKVQMPYLLEKSLNKKEENLLSTEGLKLENVVEKKDTVSFDFSLVDKNFENISPQIENTLIHEGADLVEIVSITSVVTPPSVVLLIDSSGSMKGEMSATIEAAKSFIEGLPEDSYIKVVDFDSEVKIFEGTTKADGIEALETITASGYTALYDGVMKSLSLLESLDRGTLVIFTDGTNELHPSNISNSNTNLDQVLSAVNASSVQTFAIGFGEGHDGSVLKSLASEGSGQYFSAENQMALTQVFEAINDKINATYTATYKRPSQSAPSDVPIVNIVIDVSGSMDMIWDETTGYRMEKMKNLFHDFIDDLPENTQIQIMSFNSEVYVDQMMTADKLKVFRALGLLEAGGGTNILDSVKAGYQSLAAIPSTQKVMIYLTDAALSVPKDEEEGFYEVLEEIAREEVNVLWIGLGDGLNEEDFAKAAEMSNGAYTTSEDPSLIKASTDALLSRIATKEKASKTTISVQVKKEEEQGKSKYFSASTLAELSPINMVGKAELVDAVRYVTDEVLNQYDEKTSAFISGDQLAKEAIKISKRMSIDQKNENEAMAIKASEIIFMESFNGIKAPSDQRFVALFVEVDHILPKQEVVVYPDGSGHPANWVSGSSQGKIVEAEIPYVIPNVFNHFSLSYNNDGMYPMSTATWCAEKPLVNPGQNPIYLSPKEKIEGVMVYLVPDESMHQLSLHYYDTDYGHIHMPLVGEIKDLPVVLEDLPLDVATKLHEGFEMVIDQYENQSILGKRITVNENNIFKILNGRIQTLIQANLAINPTERIHLLSHTDQGDFYFPIDPNTEILPFGMVSEQMISPGANNKIAFSFLLPESLGDNHSTLMVDLREEDVWVPVQEGPVFSTGTPLATSSHEYFDVTINNLHYSSEDVAGLGNNYVVLDLTIHDKKDGFASRGLIDGFRLVKEGHQLEDLKAHPDVEQDMEKRMEIALSSSGLSGFASPQIEESDLMVNASDKTSKIILGFDDETIIYDGTSRRGYVLFRVDQDLQSSYNLQSTLFKDLNVPVLEDALDIEHLTRKMDMDYDDAYGSALSAAIDAAVLKYNSKQAHLDQAQLKKESLDNASKDKITLEPPMMALEGALKMDEIKSINDLMTLISTLKVLYDGSSYNQNLYTYEHSPEAVLTQGWATIADLSHLTIRGLSKLGYEPKRHVVSLSKKGIEELGNYLDYENHGITKLPAISFIHEGQNIVWLMPYVKDFSRLSSHGTYDLEGSGQLKSQEVAITVEYLIEPISNSFAFKAAEASSALSGASVSNEPYYEEVFSEYISLSELSKSCIDLGVTMIDQGYTPMFTTLENHYKGKVGIDPNGYKILGIKIEIDLKGQEVSHVTLLPEGTTPEGVFMTLAINAPNFTEDGYMTLSQAADTLRRQIKSVDELSALKWYGRSIISRYLSLQSSYERKIANAYGFDLGHISKDQAVILTQMIYDGKHKSQIDLLNPVTKALYNPSQEKDLDPYLKSYYLMSGLHASVAEAMVLEDGIGILDIWTSLPDTTDYLLIPAYAPLDSVRDQLVNLGMTEAMLEHFHNNPNYILIPNKSLDVYGIGRWAWLEIDPDTYETISVLDDFTHFGFTEKAIIDALKSGAQYMIGVFAGVDTSLWSVSKYSLELDDYEEIKKAAYAYAMGLKNFFNVNGGPASIDFGSAEGALGLGPIKANFGLVDAKWQGSLGENVLGFSNGYAEGVNLYFDIMD